MPTLSLSNNAKEAQRFSEYAGVAQQYAEGERVDPITRKPFLGANLQIESGRGITRANKLGGTNGDKAPTVITDYLGKESTDAD